MMAFENVMFSQPVAKGGDLNCFGVICLMYSNTVYLQCSNLKGFTMGQMYPQHFGSRVIKRLHYLWFREVSCIKSNSKKRCADNNPFSMAKFEY